MNNQSTTKMTSMNPLDSRRKTFQQLSTEFTWLRDFCMQFQETVGSSNLAASEFPPLMGRAESLIGNSVQNPESLIGKSVQNSDSLFGNSSQNPEYLIGNSSSPRLETRNLPSQIPTACRHSVWDNPPPTVVSLHRRPFLYQL